jgi:hypothetical protein
VFGTPPANPPNPVGATGNAGVVAVNIESADGYRPQ